MDNRLYKLDRILYLYNINYENILKYNVFFVKGICIYFFYLIYLLGRMCQNKNLLTETRDLF